MEVVKQEMKRVNIDILGISELKWTGMGDFNSDDHHIYYCGQEPLRINGVAIIVNKRVRNALLECSLKNDRMISVYKAKFACYCRYLLTSYFCIPVPYNEQDISLGCWF